MTKAPFLNKCKLDKKIPSAQRAKLLVFLKTAELFAFTKEILRQNVMFLGR